MNQRKDDVTMTLIRLRVKERTFECMRDHFKDKGFDSTEIQDTIDQIKAEIASIEDQRENGIGHRFTE